MAGQRRLHSLLEAIINCVIGVGISLASQLVIFHFYGVELSLAQNLQMTMWFTLISIGRQFVLRRAFNWWEVHAGNKRVNVRP
jgi:hypothetical protein